MTSGTVTSHNAGAMAEGVQEDPSGALPRVSTPRQDWELEAPAHLGAPFESHTQYRTSTQATIRGLILLLAVVVVAFAGAVASMNAVAITLMGVVLLAALVVTALMIRRAVRAEVRADPRDTLHRQRVRR